MKKKGFTIVEIIISISIILIVGVSTTFFIFNKKSNKELIMLTKEILEAANLYASNEVDNDGNIYLNEVRNGRSGVKIPLANLVNKGYIKEELNDEVIDLSNKGTSHNYYIMLLTNKEYCDGSVFSLASWIDEDVNKEVYLCNKSGGIEDEFAQNFFIQLDRKYTLNEIESKDSFTEGIDFITYYGTDNMYSVWHSTETKILSNGLYKRFRTYDESDLFYFRGMVFDNYVKIGNIMFRIVSFNDKEIKLITEEQIDLKYYQNASGEDIEIKEDYGLYSINFGNSKLKNALETWLNENIDQYFIEALGEEIYLNKKFSFFKNTIFGEEFGISGITSNIGLLSEYETKLVGVVKHSVKARVPSDESYNRVNCDTVSTFLNFSWNSKQNTLLLSYEGYYLHSDDVTINKNGSNSSKCDTGVIKTIPDTYGGYWTYNRQNINSFIRPVISLNIENIKFSGSGVISNPYVFEPK